MKLFYIAGIYVLLLMVVFVLDKRLEKIDKRIDKMEMEIDSLKNEQNCVIF